MQCVRFSPRILALLLICVTLLASCSPEDSLSVKLSDLEMVRFDPGYHFESVELSNKTVLPFVLHSPGVTANSRLPLIIVLHPGQLTGEFQGEVILKSLFFPGLGDLRAIFVAPTAVLGHWASEAELELIEALIEGMIEADWPIDPSRIVLSGFSAGGTGTWYMTGTNPALFRAGISIAAEPLAGSLEGTRLVPKYVIHSRADLEFLFDDVQIEVQAEIDAGAPIVFALVDDLSHNAFYAYLPALEGARLWLSEILN